jgi:hypothetical protein
LMKRPVLKEVLPLYAGVSHSYENVEGMVVISQGRTCSSTPETSQLFMHFRSKVLRSGLPDIANLHYSFPMGWKAVEGFLEDVGFRD